MMAATLKRLLQWKASVNEASTNITPMAKTASGLKSETDAFSIIQNVQQGATALIIKTPTVQKSMRIFLSLLIHSLQ